jgi:hypothetical protein
MLRAGIGFTALMKLLGHTDPEMTMRYVDVACPWRITNFAGMRGF